jgi:peptidoglycan/LPS O-acetylase OafA/YrhL
MVISEVLVPPTHAPRADGGPPRADGRLLSVDVLRGLACLAVVFFHVGHFSHVAEQPSAWHHLFLPFSFGGVGVTMFIVVSGFCIHLSVVRKLAPAVGTHSNWGRFWRRRFYRLYPPYLAAIALSLAAYFAIEATGRHDSHYQVESVGWDLLAHLLLIHNLFPAFHQGLLNGPFWSLGLEEQLYALYMAFLFLRNRLPFGRLLLIVFGVSALWNLGTVVLGGHWWGLARAASGSQGLFRLGRWEDWPCAYWFCWVLGAVAAEAHLNYVKLPRWCHGWPAALGLGTLWLASHVARSRYVYRLLPISESTWGPALQLFHAYEPFVAAAATFVLLNWWIRREERGAFRGRWVGALAGVGLVSYSIYLTHVPILRLMDNFLPLDYEWPSILFRFLVGIPVTLGLGFLFFLGVERHFLRRRERPKCDVRLVAASESA